MNNLASFANSTAWFEAQGPPMTAACLDKGFVPIRSKAKRRSRPEDHELDEDSYVNGEYISPVRRFLDSLCSNDPSSADGSQAIQTAYEIRMPIRCAQPCDEEMDEGEQDVLEKQSATGDASASSEEPEEDGDQAVISAAEEKKPKIDIPSTPGTSYEKKMAKKKRNTKTAAGSMSRNEDGIRPYRTPPPSKRNATGGHVTYNASGPPKADGSTNGAGRERKKNMGTPRTHRNTAAAKYDHQADGPTNDYDEDYHEEILAMHECGIIGFDDDLSDDVFED